MRKLLFIIILFFSTSVFADRHFVNEKMFVNEQIAENDLSIISYLNSDFEIIEITQSFPDISIYHLQRYDLLEEVFEKHSLVIQWRLVFLLSCLPPDRLLIRHFFAL